MPVWHEMQGLAFELAVGQSNHSFWRLSRYCAASRGFQSAAKAGTAAGKSQSKEQTAARPSILSSVYTGRGEAGCSLLRRYRAGPDLHRETAERLAPPGGDLRCRER